MRSHRALLQLVPRPSRSVPLVDVIEILLAGTIVSIRTVIRLHLRSPPSLALPKPAVSALPYPIAANKSAGLDSSLFPLAFGLRGFSQATK